MYVLCHRLNYPLSLVTRNKINKETPSVTNCDRGCFARLISELVDYSDCILKNLQSVEGVYLFVLVYIGEGLLFCCEL